MINSVMNYRESYSSPVAEDSELAVVRTYGSKGQRQQYTPLSVSVSQITNRRLALMLGEAERQINQAVAASIEKTGKFVKSTIIRAVREDLNLKRDDLDANKTGHRYGGVELKLDRVGGQRFARVFVSGSRIPLYRFDAKPQEPRQKGDTGYPRGVRYRIGRDGGRGWIKTNAFVAKMRSGHVGIFRRVDGNKRYRIREIFGPSIPHVALRRPAVQALIDGGAQAKFDQFIDSQIDRFIGGNLFTSTGDALAS